jgi:hypothetical protein
MACLTALNAHLGTSFKSRLSRSMIPRIALGTEKVQNRCGTASRISSMTDPANRSIRFCSHDGHSLVLQEKASSSSCPHDGHRMRAEPHSWIPQSMYLGTTSSQSGRQQPYLRSKRSSYVDLNSSKCASRTR